MKEKKVRCLNCENFIFDPGSPDYLSKTPGSDWCMGCDKKRWWLDGCDYPSQEEFVNQLNQSRVCDDYIKRKKEVKKDG